MQKHRLLVVDDEWNMRNLIKINLRNEPVQITEAQNGREALEFIEREPFDLVILDIMMPDIDGWEVCRSIRQQSSIPILMLTARTDVKDVVRGLNEGADDYVTKPFVPEEFVARVHALLRRTKLNQEDKQRKLVFKDLVIDDDAKVVYVKGERINLTRKEFELLFLLASQPNRVFTREMLLDRIWGPEHIRDDRTVDTHVKNIREKFRKKNLSYDPIQTIWGIGYQFEKVDG